MKLLLAVDLRSNPEPVLAEATRWAERLAATLDLIFVDDTPDAAAFVGDPSVRAIVVTERARLHETYTKRIAELVGTLPEAIRGAGDAVQGLPADVVAERAPAYDAVMVATAGRTGFAHLWLGSVAEKIVRFSPVPVIVLRLKAG